MKLFRLRRKPESGQEEKELVLDTEAEAQAPAQDRADAEAQAPAQDRADAEVEAEAPAPEGDLMTQISAETNSEIEAEEKASEEDTLDPDLVDIFREAKNEVEESTLASELEDIATQDLLDDLVGIRHRLSIMPRARAEPGQDGK
jgi:membrane protein involved in colicin uptake